MSLADSTTHINTAADYLPHAQARLPQSVWEYLQHGTGEQISLARNRTAFNRIALLPDPLTNVAGGNTALTLFGQRYAHPFILAPIAYQTLFHADGEMASAMAANAQAGQMIVSSLASQTVESIANAANQALWFQLYWQGNRERTLQLLKRALAAGYNAIVFTVDAPVKQAVMQLPQGISAVNLQADLLFPPLHPNQSAVFDGWMQQAPTWQDVAWLREQTTLPFLIKGIMREAQALQAVALGYNGLIVSNHGGRVLDGTPAALDCLPSIAHAVSGKAAVLFDSGIRSGQDAFKALALGAQAVLVGRPYVWGLAAAGAMGVAHVLKLMRDELEMTMALMGCRSLDQIASCDGLVTTQV